MQIVSTSEQQMNMLQEDMMKATRMGLINRRQILESQHTYHEKYKINHEK